MAAAAAVSSKKRVKKLGGKAVDRLRKQIHMLHVLRSADRRLRKRLLQHADKDLVTTLGECSLNVLSSNQPISDKCKQTLRKYKTEMRKISLPHSKVSWQRKRHIIRQRGGFLNVLLGSVLSGLLSRFLQG